MTKRSLQWLVAAPDEKNLATKLTADELSTMAQDVIRDYDVDRANRAEWDAQSERALKLAKQVLEKKSTPWEGAANVKYPLITVATIQFAARAYPEICYSYDTEVLTGLGWKPIWDVMPGTFVYSRRPDGVAGFCSVTGTTSHFAERLVYFKGKSIDLLVTEAHQMLLEDSFGQQSFSPASDFFNEDGKTTGVSVNSKYIPLTSICENRPNEYTYGIPTSAYMRFLGWFISEGCATKCRNGTAWGTFKISQSASNHEKYSSLKADIEACGFDYTENPGYIIVHAKTMPEELKAELRSLGRHADKYIPRHVMFNSAADMNELLWTLLLGDGHETDKGHRLYVTTSRQLADDVQELCQYIGIRATIQKIAPTGGIIWDCDEGRQVQGVLPIYRVTLGKRTRVMVKKLHREFVDYNNRVFCVETAPWHTLYVRRNGVPVWCGNCKGSRIVKCQITGDDPKQSAPVIPPMAGMPSPNGPQAGLPAMAGPPPAGTMSAQPPAPIPQSSSPMPMMGGGQMMPPQGQPQPGSPPEPMPESQKQARANRISQHMNWQLTQEMSDWEADTDCMLHVLPVVGQCYKKTYFSSQDRHNISELVLPDDCVVSKGRSRDIKKARRITHRLWVYENEAVEKMNSKVWLDVDLGTAPSIDSDTDAPHEFYEQHRWDDLDGDGYKEPYIVTVHKTTAQVVRVVARWIPDGIELGDNGRLVRIIPDHYFTHFGFIPNPDGSINYLGFGQLLEAINASANTALNQLLDSGTLANAGGGFIGKGVRLRGGTWNFRPGEWKLVDVHGAALKENIVPLPAKEPSTVLFQLLGFLVQAGKDISSLQDILSGDAKLASNMPVGTIMALVEQGLKVFTGIYKRVYRSLSEEFKKMYNLNARFLEPEVTFYISGQSEQYVKQSDYIQGDTMVMPVADPELSSDMQRVLKSQALKELSGRPGLNEVEMTRRLVKAVRPENVDDLLLTDGQMSGKEPTPWSPPPAPQQVLAQAKAQRMMQQAQEAQVRLQMDMLKFKLELQELEEKIGNVKADTMLKLAKTEDTGRGVYLEYYKLEMQRLAQETEAKLAGVKGAVDKFAGSVGPENEAPEPTGMEPPMSGMPPAEGMMIPARAGGGPVNPNQPYLVGERGPEVVIPTANAVHNPELQFETMFNEARELGLSPPRSSSLEDMTEYLQRANRIKEGRLTGVWPDAQVPVPMADGGPVMAGQPYMVGEAGPEVVVPQQGRFVVPNPMAVMGFTDSGKNSDSGNEAGGITSGNVFNQAIQQYPILQKLDIKGSFTDSPGKYGDIESWPVGEEGTTDYARPKDIPIDSFGVQVFGGGKTKPIDVLADVASHHMINIDPQMKEYYQQFNESLTPYQKEKLQRDYVYAQQNDGETRPIDQWAKASRIPAYFRGYTFNQWDDEWNQKFYTPEQRQLLDKVRNYLGVEGKQ